MQHFPFLKWIHWLKLRSVFRRLALTAYVETGPGQNVPPLLPVADQVVSRLLPGAVQVVHGDSQRVAARHRVAAARETNPVQRPVQRAGGEAQLGAQRARGRQSGADAENRILWRHHRHVWVDKHTETHSSYQRCNGNLNFFFKLFVLIEFSLSFCIRI